MFSLNLRANNLNRFSFIIYFVLVGHTTKQIWSAVFCDTEICTSRPGTSPGLKCGVDNRPSLQRGSDGGGPSGVSAIRPTPYTRPLKTHRICINPGCTLWQNWGGHVHSSLPRGDASGHASYRHSYLVANISQCLYNRIRYVIIY